MMRLRRQIWRRFAKSTRGIAAVEFAMVLPVLTVLFLASFDGGRAIAVYMKVRTASYTLAAIANQYASINDAAMSGIFTATSDVLAPYSTVPLALTVSQIAIDANGNATVNWSSTQGGTARTVGSSITVPVNLATPNSYLILSEVKYSYVPMFGYFNKGAAIGLSDSLYVTPRSTTLVARTSP
ncbi:MAG TPA: TadE/TadG family type IV pilus assembly protein [Xanthobacteraceae bacterium]|nr:TadE/TadG family type IV pilus assembly protein [Xanthobacteraceae bacterium]